jgi:hypothetical protein
MKTSTTIQRSAGFTVMEMTIASAGLAIMGMMAYLVLNSGTLLYARNISTNHINTELRLSLDRICSELGQADGLPELVTADGSVCSSGSASGIRFDKYLGGPYLVNHPGGLGLQEGAASLQLQRSTHPLASPPVPLAGDVILVQGEPGLRAVVGSCTSGTVAAGSLQTLPVSLSGGLSKAVSWNASDLKSARLVHRVAVIVVESADRAELRYYPDVENLSDYDNPFSYKVLASEIALQSGGTKPFSMVVQDGKSFVAMSLGVRKVAMSGVLANKEYGESNTFITANTLLRPRNEN